MLTSRGLHRRTGTTLVELLVALTLGGLVLGMVGAMCVRQQRIYADLSVNAARSEQLRDAASILPIDLRALSRGAGDIREALDTALEFRATIASAVVCDTAGGSIVLTPPTSDASAFTSMEAPIAAGDSIWLLSGTDSIAPWASARILSTGSAQAGQCAPSGPRLVGAALTARRPTATLSIPLPPPIGSVVRVTRPLRYSLYRAGDNLWYLGARDWNTTSQQFNGIQPVSGPFLSAAQHGLAFRYLDTAGAVLATPIANASSITAIRIDLRAQTSAPVRVLSAAGPVAARVDSAHVIVLLHNRK